MSAEAAAERVWSLFERAIAADTSPEPGDHRVASDDPRLAAFIGEIARPELARLGAELDVDGIGNLIATFGEPTGEELLLVAYPACHHANDMPDPHLARVAIHHGRTYWLGQGASEGKAPFVAMVEALTRCREQGVSLAGRVMVAVSTEGSSTNDSSRVMFDELERLPAAAALMVGTECRIALGHRGRADIVITTYGTVRHSSVSAAQPSAITTIGAAQQRVDAFARRRGDDPDGRSITPYRLVCGPVAPHTMPARCELALDCRFLPGDDVERLRHEIAGAIDLPDAVVAVGPTMLAAATDPDSDLVARFVEAAGAAGLAGETFTPPWTFDAGAAASRGLPVVLFGPSSDNTDAIAGADAVDAEQIDAAARTIAAVVAGWSAPVQA